MVFLLVRTSLAQSCGDATRDGEPQRERKRGASRCTRTHAQTKAKGWSRASARKKRSSSAVDTVLNLDLGHAPATTSQFDVLRRLTQRSLSLSLSLFLLLSFLLRLLSYLDTVCTILAAAPYRSTFTRFAQDGKVGRGARSRLFLERARKFIRAASPEIATWGLRVSVRPFFLHGCGARAKLDECVVYLLDTRISLPFFVFTGGSVNHDRLTSRARSFSLFTRGRRDGGSLVEADWQQVSFISEPIVRFYGKCFNSRHK